MKKIGLTLGGGGAKGFAHIPILEVFDELGIKPYCITGTSIGAIIGALYASGHSAKNIVEIIEQLIPPHKPALKDIFRNKDTFRFLELIDPHFSFKPAGLLKGEKFLAFLFDHLQISTFEELTIPLKTVSTDFWNNQQIVSESGELLSAVRASMAIPYIFSPITLNGRILVDGGLVNNVPHDLLPDECDIKIAINITGKSSTPKDKIPSPLDALLHTYDVMMDAMAQEKQANHPVDIYIRPPILDIEILDFHKAHRIYKQGLATKDDFKRQLTVLLDPPKKRRWFRSK